MTGVKYVNQHVISAEHKLRVHNTTNLDCVLVGKSQGCAYCNLSKTGIMTSQGNHVSRTHSHDSVVPRFMMYLGTCACLFELRDSLW